MTTHKKLARRDQLEVQPNNRLVGTGRQLLLRTFFFFSGADHIQTCNG